MVEINTDALEWCREQIAAHASPTIVVSMYKDGLDSGSFELGVALHAETDSFTIPLTYFTSELTREAYRAYSWLIDDYLQFLLHHNIPARRVMADFEP